MHAVRQLGEQATRERLGPSERSFVIDRAAGAKPLDLRSYGANSNIRSVEPQSQNRSPRTPNNPTDKGRPPRRGGFQGQPSGDFDGDRSRGGTRGTAQRGRGRGRGGRESGDRRVGGGKVDRLAGGENENTDDDLDIFWEMKLEELESILKECVEAEKGGQVLPKAPKHFEVADVSRDALTGQGPAVPLGTWGMSEVVEERLEDITGDKLIENGMRLQELVRKLRNGDYIRFRSDAEKDATLALARTVSEQEADLATDETGQIVNPGKTTFTPVNEETREKLMRGLLEGGYKMAEGDEGFVRELLVKLRRNETIGVRQEGAMARKIRSLLPSQRVVRVPKGVGKAKAAAA